MAYVVNANITVSWVGDGVGQLMPGPGAPLLKLTTAQLGGPWQVPGADAPSAGNITTVMTTLGTAAGTAFSTTANVARIQGWANGTTS